MALIRGSNQPKNITAYVEVPVGLLTDPFFNESKSAAVAFRLICYLHSQGEESHLYRYELAEALGLSVPTLDRAIREAKKSGWLTVEMDKVYNEYGIVEGSISKWILHKSKKVNKGSDAKG